MWRCADTRNTTTITAATTIATATTVSASIFVTISIDIAAAAVANPPTGTFF